MSDASLNQDCICFEIAKKSAADFRSSIFLSKSALNQESALHCSIFSLSLPPSKRTKNAKKHSSFFSSSIVGVISLVSSLTYNLFTERFLVEVSVLLSMIIK